MRRRASIALARSGKPAGNARRFLATIFEIFLGYFLGIPWRAASPPADFTRNLPAMTTGQYRTGRSRPLARRVLRVALVVALIGLAAPYVLAPLYRFGHPVSALMAWRWLSGAPVSRAWVDLARMSPALAKAVIVAEDTRFCSHRGVDWTVLRDVIEDAREGEVTFGGSTITQQTVKNLFFWQGRSYIRKVLEIPLALWFDLVLPKRRILEIYLNIAEWGPGGQFGAESGARRAFGRDAASLTTREAALMAAVLPNPVRRNAARPSPSLQRKAGIFMARIAAARDANACVALPPSRKPGQFGFD
jgi:monofunctional biosynthetic peptidoglycan transglycosylase